MSGVLRPGPQEVRGILAEYGLSHEAARISYPRQGDDNLNLLIATGRKKYVLRLYMMTPPDEIEYELNLVDYLVKHSFPTPLVYRRRDGGLLSELRHTPAALFEYVQGVPINELHANSAGKVATLLAELHRLTAGRRFPGKRTRTDLWRVEQFERLIQENPGVAAAKGLHRFRREVSRLLKKSLFRRACPS